MTDLLDPVALGDGPPDPFVTVDRRPLHRQPSVEPRLSGFRGFLAYASGSVPQVLAQCPTDIPAQMGLGLVVLSVGVVAAFSMTFALTAAMGVPTIFAIPVGVLWGAIIFNLDRWLIASTRKMSNIVWDFLSILPRLGLAVLLGFIISEPLILKVFDSAIEEQLAEDRAAASGEATERLVASQDRVEKLNTKIAELRSERAAVPADLQTKRDEIAALRTEIDATKAKYDAAQVELTAEVEGLSATGRSGCGPACRLKTDARDVTKAEYERVQARNTSMIDAIGVEVVGLETAQRERDAALTESNQAKITVIEEQVKAVQADAKEAFDGESEDREAGLLERIRALHHLEEKDGSLRTAHMALALMFIALDCLPVFAKFMNNRGTPRAYDMLVGAEEASIRASVDARQRDHQAEAQVHTKLVTDESEIRRDFERQNTEHYLRHAAAVQRDLSTAVIQDWERMQKERLLWEQMERARQEGTLGSFIKWFNPADPSAPASAPNEGPSPETEDRHDRPSGVNGHGPAADGGTY